MPDMIAPEYGRDVSLRLISLNLRLISQSLRLKSLRLKSPRPYTKGSMRHNRIHNAAATAVTRRWIGAAILLLLLSGCSFFSLPSFFGPSEPPPNANAEMLYKEGLDYLARKQYVNAIDRFQRVKADYPFAQEVSQAELKLGETYYLNEQYPEAIETLKEFIAAHPGSEHVPYAMYTIGMAHFDQYTGSDRDQKVTEAAKSYFERVAKDFPKSPYAPQAREKLAKCLEYLAEHEFIVASFYLGEKKYPARSEERRVGKECRL